MQDAVGVDPDGEVVGGLDGLVLLWPLHVVAGAEDDVVAEDGFELRLVGLQLVHAARGESVEGGIGRGKHGEVSTWTQVRNTKAIMFTSRTTSSNPIFYYLVLNRECFFFSLLIWTVGLWVVLKLLLRYVFKIIAFVWLLNYIGVPVV